MTGAVPQDVRIETARLNLRPTAIGDVDALWPYVSDPDFPRHMTWAAHRDRSETAAFLRGAEEARRRGTELLWAIEDQRGSLCGLVGLHGIVRWRLAWRMDCAELGYWIGPPFQNRGYVTEAAEAAIRFAFERLGLNKVTVGCVAENARSKRVIEKLRFRFVGTQREHLFRDGRWCDHLAYELTRTDWQAGIAAAGGARRGERDRQREVVLRPIARSDNAAMAAIIRTVMTENGAGGPGFAIHDDEVDDMFAAYQPGRAAYLIVERAGRVVGGAGIAPLDGGDGDTCELRKMYLLAEARGVGAGARLLERCLDQARSLGYRVCYLETLDSMMRARRLYERFGFRRLPAPMGATGHFGCDAWYALDL